MRIDRIYVSGYKRVDATLTWSSAVVLFGRNDAGKSNILEAVASAVGGGDRREDPLADLGNDTQISFVIELDQLEHDDSFDAQLLARLLQTRHVPPLFPYAFPNRRQMSIASKSCGEARWF
jgi:recombinational DNA repair ATPase RecF